MKKWWMAAALAAMVVSQSAQAQYPPDGGGGLLPEPAPVAPSGGHGDGQQWMPGPLPAAAAPPGPDEGLSLPSDVPTAWGKGPVPEEGVYFYLGAQGLMRQRPGNAVIALDPTLDRNVLPSYNEVLGTHQIDPQYVFGPRLTVGYLFDNAAIELTGFYLPKQQSSASAVLPNVLTAPFYNPPSGLVGNGNGLWSQANSVTVALQSSMGNVELNYRTWSRALTGVEGILGLRYMNVQERATIFTDDTATAPLLPNGGSNLAFSSTYMARVNNNLFLPQTGLEWTLPLRNWVSFGVLAKTGFGADDIQLTTRMTDGNGVVGYQARHSEWTYTSLNEVSLYLDFVVLEKMRIRAGYTAMYLLHIAEGLSQVDYNLATQSPSIHDGGSIFYHGPMLEVQFLF